MHPLFNLLQDPDIAILRDVYLKKNETSYGIPTRGIIRKPDIFSDVLCNNFNSSILSSNFLTAP